MPLAIVKLKKSILISYSKCFGSLVVSKTNKMRPKEHLDFFFSRPPKFLHFFSTISSFCHCFWPIYQWSKQNFFCEYSETCADYNLVWLIWKMKMLSSTISWRNLIFFPQCKRESKVFERCAFNREKKRK